MNRTLTHKPQSLSTEGFPPLSVDAHDKHQAVTAASLDATQTQENCDAHVGSDFMQIASAQHCKQRLDNAANRALGTALESYTPWCRERAADHRMA